MQFPPTLVKAVGGFFQESSLIFYTPLGEEGLCAACLIACFFLSAHIWGLGIAVVHEILALGTDVRLIQSLLNV